tara:strand:+ start:1151 stop:1396 length:246 start_codon:yes stop_codon:yes gene_type:complete
MNYPILLPNIFDHPFTKDIFNKPNIAKPMFKKKRSMNGEAAIKEEDYYIYQYQIYGVVMAMFESVLDHKAKKIRLDFIDLL